MREAGGGRVGSVVGRYYAMDRDQRWDRTEQALDLLVPGEADHRADTGEAAIRAAYERGETDEFITPTTVGDEARIRPGDHVLAFNFRPDRMRQITTRLAEVVDPLHDYDLLRRGLGLPDRLPAASPGGHDRRRHRRRGPPSCTSPRRRSTRT